MCHALRLIQIDTQIHTRQISNNPPVDILDSTVERANFECVPAKELTDQFHSPIGDFITWR